LGLGVRVYGQEGCHISIVHESYQAEADAWLESAAAMYHLSADIRRLLGDRRISADSKLGDALALGS